MLLGRQRSQHLENFQLREQLKDQLRAYPFLVIMSDSVTRIDIDTHPIFGKIASVYSQTVQHPREENSAEQTKLQSKHCGKRDGRTVVS